MNNDKQLACPECGVGFVKLAQHWTMKHRKNGMTLDEALTKAGRLEIPALRSKRAPGKETTECPECHAKVTVSYLQTHRRKLHGVLVRKSTSATARKEHHDGNEQEERIIDTATAWALGRCEEIAATAAQRIGVPQSVIASRVSRLLHAASSGQVLRSFNRLSSL